LGSPGFELSKKSGGLTSAYSLSLSLDTGNSASLTTAGGGGLKLTPRGIPGHLVWGVEQITGGFKPPTPRQFKHWGSHIGKGFDSSHCVKTCRAASRINEKTKLQLETTFETAKLKIQLEDKSIALTSHRL
jgi:hypothetical protein